MTDDPRRLYPYRFARWLIPRLPKQLAYWVAARGADLGWLYARQARANFEHNQRRALGPGATERDIALSARTAMRNLSAIMVDEFRIPALSAAEMRDLVTIYGLEHLEAAHAKGKGIVLASAHFGAPNIVGQLLAILGYPTTVLVEHIQPENVFQFYSAMRSSHGLRMLAVDGPLITLLKTLRKEKGIVGAVCDRDITGTGVHIPFLGEVTNVATGPAQLAISTGAALLVAVCQRLPDHSYIAHVFPELQVPTKPADPDAAIRDLTAQVMAPLEAAIREQPGQWVMSVPLWKDDRSLRS